MQAPQATFIKGAVAPDQFPELNLPEVGFIGRSNVGKSSLINSIVMRKNLARISSTPGKTREINFFLVQEKWVLVDMPGYGYAAVGKSHRKKWAILNNIYIQERKPLKFVCILIDGRHDPMPIDLELIENLENIGRKYLIILTKCDKISKKNIVARKEQIENIVSLCNHCIEVLPYSTVSNLGRNELIGIIKKNI
ncbi:MAG: YihA family ribosome biogenesis GTP-binding protein [Ignavibacteria bacterium]|jgi:GTP-binding protein|nr:YihA family ribosome biogenesis GTP-binding protein [Ignavibacteria bacterium]